MMSQTNTPEDGDFSKLLEQAAGTKEMSIATDAPAPANQPPAPAHELLAEADPLPPLSDEELERQALEDGGADNDPFTPE